MCVFAFMWFPGDKRIAKSVSRETCVLMYLRGLNACVVGGCDVCVENVVDHSQTRRGRVGHRWAHSYKHSGEPTRHVLGDVHPQMMLRLLVDPFGKTTSVACTTASTPFARVDQSVHVHVCTEAVSMSPKQLHDRRQDVLGFSRLELEGWPGFCADRGLLEMVHGSPSRPCWPSLHRKLGTNLGDQVSSPLNCGVCDRPVEPSLLPTLCTHCQTARRIQY